MFFKNSEPFSYFCPWASDVDRFGGVTRLLGEMTQGVMV